MQLQEKGELNVNDPITKYLPDYPKEPGDRITIKHLLTHTSGIPNYTDLPDLMARRTEPITLTDLIATFKDKPLDFQPGEKWKYSNSGYVLLGAIIEAVAKEPFDRYFEENILKPAGMKETGADFYALSANQRAIGYSYSDSGKFIAAAKVHKTVPAAAGALYSNVEDMLIWDQALYGDKIVTRKSLAEMFTPVKNDYGYGWLIDTVYSHKRVWHNGGIDGFSTTFHRILDDSTCVVVLCNSDNGPTENVARALESILYEKPYDIPVVKTPIALDTAIYKDYVGAYKIDTGSYRLITYDKGELFSQRTGGVPFHALPEAKDKFFLDFDNTITLTFVRDASGAVISQVMHQNGLDATSIKLTGAEAEKVLKQRQVANVNPTIYDKYVGEYELAPGFILTVTHEGDKIFTQATGQAKIEIYPETETKFFLKVVDAQIDFVSDSTGNVSQLILHQAGRNMPGRKVK
jgi:CubicO group peptidase (beta-lactamase class C family)